jgi:UDP-N-acetylglucosamine 2-epimerase (non-hydrolysing)
MSSRQFVLVGGARPNFMKLAPVIRALSAYPDVQPRLVHTGQHYDEGLSAVFFEQLELPAPDASLNVGSGSHGAQTGRVMIAFEEYLQTAPRPSGVVVVGDVNSTAACALTAAKIGIPVAHVEAGLRSFDRTMPEEINRLVTDAIADLLFVSEPSGEENLRREGIPADRVHYVGNVMIDTLINELEAARGLNVAKQFGLQRGNFVVVTLHRPSNVDAAAALQSIVAFLIELGERMAVILPLHPRTKARLTEHGLWDALSSSKVQTLAPIGYREMLGLMEAARLVITDSGGVQEETTHLNVPCLTLRDQTERPVTVTRGTNTVVGRDVEAARREIARIQRGEYKRAQSIEGWDGHAGERIAKILDEAWR